MIFPADLVNISPRTLTELGRLIVDELTDGAICIVPGAGYYQLDKSADDAVSSPRIIATGRGSSVNGRWFQHWTRSIAKSVDLGTISAGGTSWFDVTGADVTALGALATDGLTANPTNGLMTLLILSGCYVQDASTLRIGVSNIDAGPQSPGSTPFRFTVTTSRTLTA